MSKKLSDRLKKARRLYGPHNTLAVNIGIASGTLQKLIDGVSLDECQSRIVKAVNEYLSSKEL